MRSSMNLQSVAQRIDQWLINRLIPYARNPRTHSEARIAQIAASLSEFGFNNPILVDSKAGIIAGHRQGIGDIAAVAETGETIFAVQCSPGGLSATWPRRRNPRSFFGGSIRFIIRPSL